MTGERVKGVVLSKQDHHGNDNVTKAHFMNEGLRLEFLVCQERKPLDTTKC